MQMTQLDETTPPWTWNHMMTYPLFFHTYVVLLTTLLPPLPGDTPMIQMMTPPVINVDITSTVDITADIDDAAMAVDQDTDARLNSDTSVVPVGQQRQRKRKCSPAKLDRQQRRKYGSMVDKT